MPCNDKHHASSTLVEGEKLSPGPHIPTRIEHKRFGVWEIFEETEPVGPWLTAVPLLGNITDLMDCWPYLLRMLTDVLSIPCCPHLMLVYAATTLGLALIPAVTIWLQGHLLSIAQVAIETRSVDKDLLFRVSAGSVSCAAAKIALREAQRRVGFPLNGMIRRWWAVHSFHAHARLDVPTFAQGGVRRQLAETSDGYNGQAVVWQSLTLITNILSTLTQMVAQSVVLFHILRFQRDGALLVAMTLSSEIACWLSNSSAVRPMRVWIATTFNSDYLKMRGWKSVISSTDHRQEFVAGNLAYHAMSEFKQASDKVGSHDADWNEIEDMINIRGYGRRNFYQPLSHIPQIIFTFRAAHYPSTIPISLASLTLVQGAVREFVWRIQDIFRDSREFEKQLRAIRKIYEVVNIPNLVPDGVIPFPEDTSKTRCGISTEFRNVSFKYPESEQYALRNISFSLDAGQLCVIVGVNGSGKSTILKLVTRIYDPDEGQILLGGHDIRTLKLRDLREAISVLFQDYTLFPLSIRDNIAMGDPATSHDTNRVRLAARLAGAEDLIDKLPDGFDTYLERPVDDEYAMVAEGTKTVTGRVVDYSALRAAANIKSSRDTSLSGGQMQRIAVARSFMRSVVQEDSTVGLLLFDEPSAALDPAAEHDLFNRLRELRGSKTMIFSSHRFGNLTRHADLILYMDDSVIVESGNHEELLKQGGEYAKLWKLQAQAFVE